MDQTLQTKDYLIFLLYFIGVAGYGYWIYQRKKAARTTANDFFLAEGSLTWWAIGASLIASNISAEQFIGMSGSGFKMGLAIASYEWMAAATLLIVAVFFIPVYLKNKIYTMPQFLRTRYNDTVSTIMAVFWLLLYVLVNLTSILYLGAIAVSGISSLPIAACMAGLAIFAIVITLGGMKVIGYTDVIQVLVLIIGGLVTTWLALSLVAKEYGNTGAIAGFNYTLHYARDHYQMIFDRSSPHYADLPGMSILIGGMWIANLNYWGCNQYITQRALGADLPTARNGLLFAAFLKLLMPVIVVLPGIAAYVLHQKGLYQQEMLQAGELNPDRAYPVLLQLLPTGMKGLAFAALTAAIVASLAGKANSISTIFSLDIYQKKINPNATEEQLVRVGRYAVWVSMALAVIIAPFMGIDKKGGFQFIQEYTGFVSPGVFAAFLLGFFWRKTTSNAALFSIIGGFVLSVVFKFLPHVVNLSFLSATGFSVPNDKGVYEIPFIDRMGIVFMICVIAMYFISKGELKGRDNPQGLDVDASMFKTNPGFTIGMLMVCGILTALYTIFW